MEGIREYLLQITAAALVCGVVTGFLDKKGTSGALLRMLCGIFMTVTLISPILDIRLGELPELLGSFSAEADDVTKQGKEDAQASMGVIIKQQTEAYILEEAKTFGVDISVEVELNTDDIPVPCSVRIVGMVSPYGKNRLQQIIKEELGIPVEEQIWVG